MALNGLVSFKGFSDASFFDRYKFQIMTNATGPNNWTITSEKK